MKMLKPTLLALAAAITGAATLHHMAKRHQAPSTAAPAPHVPAPPRRPTQYGINLTTLLVWNHERAFMNLMAGVQWQSAGSGGWHNFDLARIDREGTILSLKPGEQAVAPMSYPPQSFLRTVPIHCTFEGKGEVQAFAGGDVRIGRSTLDFVWPKKDGAGVIINRTDPADPIRHIDCRVVGDDPHALFDPVFVNSIRPYSVARFQGWQPSNDNNVVNWDRRPSATADLQNGPEGAAVENMVALSNEAHVAPWFMMPWNADDRYEVNFARYVHDHLDPSLPVYIEMANEVWNTAFAVSGQALREGKAEGFGPDENGARMQRYAEHAVGMFKLWQRAFGADKGRLVRVLAGQTVWPDALKPALDFRDTARQVDAIAMAPYFAFDFLLNTKANLADTDRLFRELPASVDQAAGFMRQDKALADQYGLRLIAYEAGQHMIYFPDKTIVKRLNWDPRMEGIYARYLAAWNREAGDLIMLFANISPVGENASWGLAEYEGQPMSETPKRRAVLAAIAAQKNAR